MAVTIRTTLENAMYLSISDREHSPVDPSGSRINVAFNSYMNLLDVYRNEVPFLETKTINGESELLNIGATFVNSLVYFVSGSGNVTYPLTPVTQEAFERLSGVVDLRALPVYYWHDVANDLVKVYPLPQSTSDKFTMGFLPILTVSDLDKQLPSAITPFMQFFLEYELARVLCAQYNVPWTTLKETLRQDYLTKLMDNAQKAITPSAKERLMNTNATVPWMAYLSGNLPQGGS